MGPYFALFMAAWIYLRHYLNLRIIASLFTEFKTVGPYELNWETQQYKCDLSFYITLSLLASLQALNLFWLFFIIRIAYRFVVRGVAEDDRSDNEDEAEEPPEKTADKTSSSDVATAPTAGRADEDAGAAPANGSAKTSAVPNGVAKKRRG